MATFKAVVLPQKKRQDNTYNIKIRISHMRETKYISTPWNIPASGLDSNLAIKSLRYIELTNELIRKYTEIYENLGMSGMYMSATELVENLQAQEESKKPFRLDFVQYVRDYIENLKQSGKAGTVTNYQAAVNSLVRYAGKENIDIKELTTKFIDGWMRWILAQQASGGKRGGRAPSLYAACLRAMHNRAKLEFNDGDRGIIRIGNSPFAKANIPKPPLTRKRALTVEQIRSLMSAPVPAGSLGVRFKLARDVFMLSFYFVGMNAADLYNVTDFDGERLTYERTKTKTRRADRAEISIRVEPEAVPLMKKYLDRKKKRVFRFYRMYSTRTNFNAALNKGLKQVGAVLGIDDLEFYAARHSWATIAVNDAQIDKYTVHEALNHVDPAMRVTDIYIKKNWSNIDRANRKVIDLIMEAPKPKSGWSTNRRK